MLIVTGGHKVALAAQGHQVVDVVKQLALPPVYVVDIDGLAPAVFTRYELMVAAAGVKGYAEGLKVYLGVAFHYL